MTKGSAKTGAAKLIKTHEKKDKNPIKRFAITSPHK
jgi:hypothetical protein